MGLNRYISNTKLEGYSSMIIEAKKLNGGIIQCKYEVHLECSNCGMSVDAEEYKSGTCSDCGATWNGKRHTKIHVTSVPLAGKSS